MKKQFKAQIKWKNGETTEVNAYKSGGSWVVGGDFANAITDVGGVIFIISNQKVYWLKGNRLVFQDYISE